MSNDPCKGEFPIRNDITVFPPDDPKKLRLNWKIYEDYGPHMLPTESTECYDTDEADKYRGHNIRLEDIDSIGFNVVPVLEFLWGQPWNNLALNYVYGLKPSCVRVSEGTIKLDAHTDRITVFLEDDKRTIKRIEMEMRVGLIGCDCGFDLKLKLKQQVTGEKIEQFDSSIMINTDALSKVDLKETGEDNGKD